MTTGLDEIARAAVLFQLAQAHDRYVNVEKNAYGKGEAAEAEGAHQIQAWLLRAYAAEQDDPKPADRQ